MHKCYISNESGWNYRNMFFVWIEAEGTVWSASVPVEFWILVLILSLADQAGQDLVTSINFCLSLFSALSENNISFPCLNALQGPSSVPCWVQLLHWLITNKRCWVSECSDRYCSAQTWRAAKSSQSMPLWFWGLWACKNGPVGPHQWAGSIQPRGFDSGSSRRRCY